MSDIEQRESAPDELCVRGRAGFVDFQRMRKEPRGIVGTFEI